MMYNTYKLFKFKLKEKRNILISINVYFNKRISHKRQIHFATDFQAVVYTM